MRNKFVKKNRRKTLVLPDNIILLASHGSAKVPKHLASFLNPAVDKRLLRNFSDFATKSLLQIFSPKNVVVPKYGRLVGDPNRSFQSHDFFRFTDFGGIQIWKEKFLKDFENHTKRWKKQLAEASRQHYFDEIFARLETALKNPKNKNKPIIVLDFHDTGNLILGRDFAHDKLRQQLSDFVMPKVILSNVDDKTAPHEFMEFLREKFTQHLKVSPKEVQINNHFKGGYVTQYFGGAVENETLQKLLKKYKRSKKDLYVVQVELNRDLYLDESHQTILPQMGRMRSVIKKTLDNVITAYA